MLYHGTSTRPPLTVMCRRGEVKPKPKETYHHRGREQDKDTRDEHQHHHRVLEHREDVEAFAGDEVVMLSSCRKRDWVRKRYSGGWREWCSGEIRSYFRQGLRLVDVDAHLRGRTWLLGFQQEVDCGSKTYLFKSMVVGENREDICPCWDVGSMGYQEMRSGGENFRYLPLT